tara:strand:- start:342 stop:1571 length:1230 start_codon:yes stop_codon:yes gene_type:complete
MEWKEDEFLTHVGPRTPCGEYLRRFWHPIAYTDSLTDVPTRVRVLGEDLILFRDGSEQFGLLALNCAHRGTSLEFGLIQERGIRCCYHGWLYDVDGTLLETPGEPSDNRIKKTVFQGAYPTREFNGLVFAYFGPSDKQPEFPNFDTWNLPGYTLKPWGNNRLPCNWVQIKENCMDPAHTAFLHTIGDGTGFTESFGVIPELEFQEVPNGEVYIAARRVGDNVWIRSTNWILPNIHQYSPTWEDGTKEKIFSRAMQTHWAVPIDDTNTLNIGFNHYHEDDPPPEILESGADFGQGCDRPFEERQRVPGDYDAHSSIGPISIHARENLGATDIGVAMFRQILRKNIEAVASGGDPSLPDIRQGQIQTYANDTILKIPRNGDDKEDQELLRAVGRKVTKAIVSRNLDSLNDL